TIKGPNRDTCSVRSAPNAEPAPPSCCRPATPKLCSFTSMRSQPKSRRALTLFSSSIKPGGMAPRPSRFQTTSRSCSSRHAHPNSTAKKISGNSCGRTGCRTEFSNPSTTSSITAATPGTPSSISRGKSCPSPAAIGQPQVTQFEDWYYMLQVCRQLTFFLVEDRPVTPAGVEGLSERGFASKKARGLPSSQTATITAFDVHATLPAELRLLALGLVETDWTKNFARAA